MGNYGKRKKVIKEKWDIKKKQSHKKNKAIKQEDKSIKKKQNYKQINKATKKE